MPSDRRRRSRSPREHKKKKEKSSSRLERKRKGDEDTSVAEASPPRKERKEDGEEEEEEGGGGQQGEVSMSVEETNKLREKLGLKPLEVSQGPTVVESETDPRDKIVTEDGKTFTHRAAENWGDKKNAQTIREKLAIAREKRRLAEKFGGKGLAEEEEGEDSAASWVDKMRRQEQEKRLARERAKMLEEMDETFGVGDLVDKDAKKKKAKADRASASRLPKAFTVEHSKEQFLENGETVLVLKDKGVLEEGDEETLINPTMVEHEQWKRNAELRKRKPGYNPYSDLLDEDGNLKERGVLDKYDEENLANDGLPKKETFSISETGDVDLGPERRQAQIKARLREAKEALRNTAETPLLEPAREYYTEQEMAAFKKPRKKKAKEGLRKKKGGALKADDLLAESADADFGSRQRGRGKRKAAFEGEQPEGSAAKEEEEEGSLQGLLPAPQEQDEEDLWGPEGDLAGVVVDDEAEDELASALEKARKLKTTTVKEDPNADAGEKVAEMLSQLPPVKPEPDEKEEEAEESGQITMDATSEYCRHLGDDPANPASLASASAAVDVQEEEEEMVGRRKRRSKDEERKRRKAKWRTIEDGDGARAEAEDQEPMEGDSSDSEDLEDLLGSEAKASSSVAEAIRLAVQKGYLEPGKKVEEEAKLKELECKRYSQIDRQFQDIDDKYARKLERMGMGGGPVRSFEERKDYKPNVNLTYCDETGRPMDVKQAFRYMSWKFHGKKPGKMKTEKRRIKLEETEKVTRLDSADTPLGTLDKQRRKQEREGLPFVPLSGQASQIALPKD